MAAPRPVVLFEDASLLVLDKPAGLHTAPLRAAETGTLLSDVIERHPEVAALPGMKPVEPGLVHRLDRDTSGIVVVARTADAFHALRAQFDAGEARKEYHAVCRYTHDSGPQTRLEVQSRFAPLGIGRRMVRVVTPEEKRGRILREASPDVYTTRARVEEREDERALLSVEISRGFRHQVRAHLSHLGCPIYGDPLYGVPVPRGAPRRMYLHASGITLLHPLTRQPIRIVSPLPEEFRRLMLARPGQIG